MNCVDKYPGAQPVRHLNDITADHDSKDAPSLAASAVPLKLEARDRISFFHLLRGRQNSGLSVTFLNLFEKCYSKRMSNKKVY